MPDAQPHIAVVGTGLTGTVLALHLMEALPDGARLSLFGTTTEPGRGLAYATPDEAHLLNVPAYRMSLYPDDPHHFMRWLWAEADTGPDSSVVPPAGYTYVPRARFGDYVEHAFSEVAARNGNRLRVELYREEVTACHETGTGVRLQTREGSEVLVEAAALCLGNASGRLPLAAGAITGAASARIIDDPWRDPRLAAIDPDDAVLLVGTGLTMVDRAISLKSLGHRGPIVALSRHGLVPHAQVEPRPAPVLPVSLEGTPGLLALMRDIRRAAKQKIAEGGDWRAIVDGLRPVTQSLWQGFSGAEKRRFLRHLNAYWSVHRHRIAPPVASGVDELLRSGQMTVLAGKLQAIGGDGDRLAVLYRPRGAGSAETLAVDWVVNCAGLDRANADLDRPVLAQMIADGHARLDELGIGLDATADSALLGRDGTASRRLYAAGPTTVGRFFEIVAVPDIRVQCRQIAQRMASAGPLTGTA
jgi:uncharacterized NAD(P)/FAD-binding protein YdhS